MNTYNDKTSKQSQEGSGRVSRGNVIYSPESSLCRCQTAEGFARFDDVDDVPVELGSSQGGAVGTFVYVGVNVVHLKITRADW